LLFTLRYTFPMALCAFDIDGTLIDDTFDSEGKFIVYPEIIDALNQLLLKGHTILFASGRSLPGLVQFSKKLIYPEKVFYSTSNGTCLYDGKGNLFYSSYIPYHVFIEMYEIYGGNDSWTYMCYTKDDVVGYLGKPNFAPEEARFNVMPCQDFNGRSFSEGTMIQKASMTTGDYDAHKIPLAPQFSAYQAYATSNFFFEIVGKDVSKAHTIAFLAEKLGIAENDIYAFGDGENDLTMVAKYHGTATGNAIESVKSVASFVAPTAADRGVAYALKEHWKLI
jgi:Cof subfamily protein (haloacid dehalogenase superfamily)